jgi:hypothetical protein
MEAALQWVLDYYRSRPTSYVPARAIIDETELYLPIVGG